MPLLQSISATTLGGRDGHGTTSDNRVTADFNSKGQGVTPEHLFALGYSACFAVTVKVDLNVGDNHDYSLAAELQVKLPGMEKSQAEELVKAADQMCPYSKAIRGNVPVKLTVL
jgi:lipoyl-dependent peroxiredoxin